MTLKARGFSGRRDVAEVVAIWADAFDAETATRYGRHLRSLAPDRRKNHRCLEVDGKIVSFIEVVPHRMYIGRALVRMAGIGGVCTHPAHRGKGYNRILWEDTFDFLRRERYDISILFGIPDYYHRYGYEVVMASRMISMSVKDLPRGRCRYKATAIRKADMPEVTRLYTREARYRDGNCTRDLMSKPLHGIKLTRDGGRGGGGGGGRMVAYAAWREQAGEIYVRDAAVVSRPVAIELLRAFRDVGFHKVCDQFNVAMPMGYPLTEAMRGLGCFEKRRFPSGAGCMGRVINLGSLAVRMRREWVHLIKRSEFAGRTARLRLEIDGNLLTIDCGPRGIRTQNSHARASSRVSWRRLAQMLLGYRSIAALADESDVKFAKQDLRLLEVLFPERNAHILGPDRF